MKKKVYKLESEEEWVRNRFDLATNEEGYDLFDKDEFGFETYLHKLELKSSQQKKKKCEKK